MPEARVENAWSAWFQAFERLEFQRLIEHYD